MTGLSKMTDRQQTRMKYAIYARPSRGEPFENINGAKPFYELETAFNVAKQMPPEREAFVRMYADIKVER